MKLEKGWLQRSLDSAQKEIKDRPEHLKPHRYQAPVDKPSGKNARKA